ncbi:hypothetical protein O0L34_g8934 [Tuta absoluta]|nr:hypothetical protein O0L34_g8934 [Tuta absoluta]
MVEDTPNQSRNMPYGISVHLCKSIKANLSAMSLRRAQSASAVVFVGVSMSVSNMTGGCAGARSLLLAILPQAASACTLALRPFPAPQAPRPHPHPANPSQQNGKPWIAQHADIFHKHI